MRDRQLYFDKKSTDWEIRGRNELWFGGYGLAKGSKEEIGKAKEIFKKMMFNKERVFYLEKYKSNINQKIEKLIKYEKEIEKTCRKLKNDREINRIFTLTGNKM